MNNPEGTTNISAASSAVKKLTPRALAILLAIAILTLAAVIGFAIYKDRPVSLWGLTIGQSSGQLRARISELESELSERPTPEEVERLKVAVANALIPKDLPGLLHPGMTKQEMVALIQENAKRAAKLDELEESADFVFLQLDRALYRYGGSINTRRKGQSRTEVYRLIQLSLRAVGFFDGEPNGDQTTTNRALRMFQRQYNASAPERAQLKPIGIFGRRTYNAIREKYFRITEGT